MASIQGKGKPSKALRITSVFSDIMFTFKFYSILCYEGVKIIRLVLVISGPAMRIFHQ